MLLKVTITDGDITFTHNVLCQILCPVRSILLIYGREALGTNLGDGWLLLLSMRRWLLQLMLQHLLCLVIVLILLRRSVCERRVKLPPRALLRLVGLVTMVVVLLLVMMLRQNGSR